MSAHIVLNYNEINSMPFINFYLFLQKFCVNKYTSPIKNVGKILQWKIIYTKVNAERFLYVDSCVFNTFKKFTCHVKAQYTKKQHIYKYM